MFTTICWKGVSFPLGMAIDLISLLWAILRSSRLHWPLLRLHFGLRTKRGKLVPLRRHLCWTSLHLVLLLSIFLLRTQLFFWLFLSFVSVLALEGVPGFVYCCPSGRLYCLHCFLDSDVSVHCARDHAHPVVRRGPWSFCDRGEMVVRSAVTGAPPGSLSARCVVFTVSPCLIIFLPFFRPLIIDPAGPTVPAGSTGGVTQVGQWYSGWYAACYVGGYSSWYRYCSQREHDGDPGSLRTSCESFGQTPLVVPVRGHLDSSKENSLRRCLYRPRV